MNEKLFKKLYTEITRDSNDLMDGGRAELALELITENSSFLEENYPNYYGCSNIACIDDLSKVVFKSDEAGSHARMLSINLGYSRCLDWLAKEEAKAYTLAFENKIAKASAYDSGFKDGLNTGEENNPFEDGELQRAYRDGYSTGVTEYCEKNS